MTGAVGNLSKRLTGRSTAHKGCRQFPTRSGKSRVARERMRQIVLSIPHYFKELARIRRPSELYGWVYFKFPTFFPLMIFPPYLTVEVTNECNFSCKHCSRTVKAHPIGYMDVALFEKIVREVSLHRSFQAFKILGDGEATLHPRFRELMEIAAYHAMPTYVYTNGSLFQLFSPREILSWKLDTIVVSGDGLDAESHERFKIGSNYASLKKAVMDFYKCRKLSGSRTPIIHIRHVMLPKETSTQLLQLRRAWLETADTVKFDPLDPVTDLYDFENPSSPKCRGIRREMGIWWDGTAPLCIGYWRDYLGNVRDSTISELWRHPKMEYLRQCQKRRDFAKVPVCLRCVNAK
jgi:MoaA/NifB/PqqE/SkfB family radical SAM enzyme